MKTNHWQEGYHVFDAVDPIKDINAAGRTVLLEPIDGSWASQDNGHGVVKRQAMFYPSSSCHR